MANVITNKLRYKVLGWVFRGVALPTNFYVALITNAAEPTADTNTKAEITEIANGNGYTTGGYQLTRNSTDFDVWTEDDVNDRALIQVKDLVWTANTGPIPASGTGIYYAILTDDNATDGSREIYGKWDVGTAVSVSDGQTITLQDLEIRAT